MSGRGEDRNGESVRTALRGALIVVAIAAVLGVFGGRTGLQRPSLSPLNLAGIALMLVGLSLALLARTIAERLARRGEGAVLVFKLLGVLLCGVGAIMVFL